MSPDFKLIVWYHGLKATQYFSKFTPESITILKKDLTILGLPQPKNQNVSLLSHGAVECWWPSAGMNPVLYRNLIMKTTPTPAFHDTINQLSILNIAVKETSASHPPVLNSNSVKPASLKRPYEQRASASVLPVVPMVHLADPPRGQQALRNQNSSGYRPQLTHPTAVPSYSLCDDSSRPNKVAKTHAQVFQLSTKSVDNGHPQNSFASVTTNRLQISTPTTPLVNPSSWVNPSARLAANSDSKMTQMNLQPLRTPNLGSSIAGVEKERVDAFLNNLLQPIVSQREQSREIVPLPRNPVSQKLPQSNSSALSNVRTERQATAAANSDKIGGVPGQKTPNSTTVKVVPVPTPSTSAPPSNLQSTTFLPTPVNPSLNSESLMRLVQSTTASKRSIIPRISPTLPSIGAKGTETSAVQPTINPAAPRLLEDVSRNIGEWFAEGHEMRKHGVQGGINPEREKALKLEEVIEELKVVKNELEEERRSRREDKERLDAERQRREEAENALADVRRECRQPFVVPSLLDAFVELSKLTTRGLKASGSQVETSVYPSVPSPQDREVEDASSTVANGRDINASHNEGSSSLGVRQRTKVKLEPLDDTVML